MALSKVSNKYVANTDIYYHMIQMAFCTLFIKIHISLRLLAFTNNQHLYIEHKKMLLIVGFGFNHVIRLHFNFKVKHGIDSSSVPHASEVLYLWSS